MKEYNRLIFTGQTGACREAMAVAILGQFPLKRPIKVMARGLVVLFSEPMNQKAEAVLISNGVPLDNFVSQQLKEEELTEDTLVLTMEAAQKERILGLYPSVSEDNVYSMSEFIGEELDILDPYGGPLASYGLCYESMRKMIEKLVRILNGEEVGGAHGTEDKEG